MQHYHAIAGSWAQMEAERAFGKAVRARRRASLLRRCAACLRLAVHDQANGRAAKRGRREIPLDAIVGTLEPHRAEQFDSAFRPAASTRTRWTRVWMASQQGVTLPPIAVVPVGDGYAIRDGHHRVSVARAQGAGWIDAIIA